MSQYNRIRSFILNQYAIILFLLGLSSSGYVLFTNFDHGLWNDEVFSLRVTDPSNTIKEALEIQSIDASPFTYYLFLWWWRILFGAGLFEAQFFNILAFLAGGIFSWLVWPKEKWHVCLVYLAFILSSVAVNYYLLEIRTYGLIVSTSTFAGACMYGLLAETDSSFRDRRCLSMYLFTISAAVLMIALHAWGALFGLGILIALLWHDLRYANSVFGLLRFSVIGLLSAFVFLGAYFQLILVFGSRLSSAGIPPDAALVNVTISLFTGLANLLYVTDRSLILAGVAVSICLVVLVLKKEKVSKLVAMYLGPILVVYLAVFVAVILFDRFIYKDRFNLIFIPFIFLFFITLIFSLFQGIMRVFVVSILFAANLGSIPVFERFALQPYEIEIRDGVAHISKRETKR